MSTPVTTTPLFQMFGRETADHVDCINRAALENLRAILKRPLEQFGLCTLLRAPRAGYGKSHLLCRLQQELRGTHEFVLLHAADGNRFDASACLENVLTQLTRALPGGAGLTPLDLLSRKFFAMGLEPLVRSGEVPCQDRDSALHALTQRPTETFDFHHASAATAHWAREHFDVLGPRLIVELSQMLQTPMRDIAFWVEVLFRYAATPPEYPSRLAQLLAAIATSSATAAHDRLAALLHILSQWQRIVLVVDELEGLSANPEAALRLATFLTTLRHGAERIDVILSVNDDIWESAFTPRLSGGLIDRLTEAMVHLAPLSEEEALALLQSRHPNSRFSNLQQLGIHGDLYARAILRAARLHARTEPITAPSPSPQASTAVPAPTTNAIPASSPFQIVDEPAEPAETFTHAGTFPAASGFSPFTPVTESPEPTVPASVAPEPTPVPAPAPAEEGDRVNELLRQFRERYGNS
jgi:hypothetical protein